jgi:putative cell wall binding repeat protein
MRALVRHQRLVRSAAIVASATVLAACATPRKATTTDPTGTAPPTASPTSLATAPPGVRYPAGTVLISNGTDTVMIGGHPVRFPTTVTDAAWSADGSRVVFIDADNNVSTARPDGSDRRVLTVHHDGVRRSSPTWSDASVVFTEWQGGTPRLRSVWANGAHVPWQDGERDGPTADGPDTGNSAPSARSGAGTGPSFAFQHEGTHGPEVWIVDSNQRESFTVRLADGAAAEISPDGSKVAFVAGGQIEILPTRSRGSKPLQVTFGATSPSHLAWNPTGTRVAYQTPTDVRSVPVAVSPTARSNPSTQLSKTTGVPTYLGGTRDAVTRIAGTDLVGTAIAASQSRFPTTAITHGGEDWRYAHGADLVATADAARMLPMLNEFGNGPLLFTGGTSLDPRTAAELRRALGTVPPGDQWYVPEVRLLGGTGSISTSVEQAVQALGYHTTRVPVIALPDVTTELEPNAQDVVLAVDVHDVAGMAGTAIFLGSTILLVTDGDTIPTGAASYLRRMVPSTPVYAMDAAAQHAVLQWASHASTHRSVTPLFGTTAQATGAQFLDRFGGDIDQLVVVDQSAVPDVVVGVALARAAGYRVLVVDRQAGLDPTVLAWLGASSATINAVSIVDSSGAVTAAVEAQVGGWLSGPDGYTTNRNPPAH